MSTTQRNDACLIDVDPAAQATLRTQTLRVLESNHYYFEDLLQFGPEAQYALSVMFTDAFAVLDVIGWAPDPDADTVDVPLTAGHVDQLRRRREDLVQTNFDRLPEAGEPIPAETMAEIHAGHQAIGHLDELIAHHEIVAPAV
jgi:hypothetical protein